jgi:hypothetical protein
MHRGSAFSFRNYGFEVITSANESDYALRITLETSQNKIIIHNNKGRIIKSIALQPQDLQNLDIVFMFICRDEG